MVPPAAAEMREVHDAHAASLSVVPSPTPPQSRTRLSSSAAAEATRALYPVKRAVAIVGPSVEGSQVSKGFGEFIK